MDKNFIIGLVLMILIFVGFQIIFPSETPEPSVDNQNPVAQTDSSNASIDAEPANSTVVNPTISNADPSADTDSLQQVIVNQLQAEKVREYGIFAAATSGKEEEITLANDHVDFRFNSKGGNFQEVFIRNKYKTFWEKQDISLFDAEASSIKYTFTFPGHKELSTDELYFTEHDRSSSDTHDYLTLRSATSEPNKYIELYYSLKKGTYQLDCTLRLIGLSHDLDLNGPSYLDWKAAGLHNEKGIEWERQHSSVFFKEQGEGRDYLRESAEDDEVVEDNLSWMCFKQNYFSALVIARNDFGSGAVLKSAPPANIEQDTSHTMFYEAKLPLKMEVSDNVNIPFTFYMGPNDLELLEALESDEIGRIIDYGWWIFGWVNRNLIRPTYNFISGMNISHGIAILILTVLIKLVLFPVTWKNYLSSSKMRVLKPETDEINKKYKDDPTGKQKAQMELWRKTGVSPMAGCLPMLLQIPILYAMFRFFPSEIALRGESFLWADDLGAYDVIAHLPFEIPFYGAHVSGFTLLMAVSTFFYTRMSSANMPQQQQPGMPNMKLIMNFFPLMMLFFFNKYASGLSLYYFAANLISIGQMMLIKKVFIDEDKIRAKIEENKKKPKKKSNWQARLEEVQKQNEQKLKNQRNKRK